jgi:adenylate kinase
MQRDDDKEETVKNRLSVYDQQTSPLKAYYEQAGILRHVDGSGSIPDIQLQIQKVLEA